jgi:hypothetical protein
MSKYLFLSGIILFQFGCSSITKNQNYIFEPITKAEVVPQISHDKNGRPIGFNFQKSNAASDHQSIWITIENNGLTTYTLGPILLPILPVYFIPSLSHPIDRSRPLIIKYFAYSAEIYGSQIKSLAVPKIEKADGRYLEPASSAPCPGETDRCRLYTYDLTVEQMPEFILASTETILTDGSVLRTPRLHFKLNEAVQINWSELIAP